MPVEWEGLPRAEAHEQGFKLTIIEVPRRRPLELSSIVRPDSDGMNSRLDVQCEVGAEGQGEDLYCELTDAEGKQLTVRILAALDSRS